MQRALITGITGQTGSYLAELLLDKGYEVHGVVRRSSQFNRSRIEHLLDVAEGTRDRVQLHYGDMLDSTSLQRIVTAVSPHEVYNLAAQSHVKVSFEMPEFTVDTTAMGTLRLLEAVRQLCETTGRKVRVYQAGSSEMYGTAADDPQTERTPFRPRSPYAAAKVYAYWQARNYREAYDLLIWNGILFNHESPRRGESFVTRKITRAATRIFLGLQSKLRLGNLDAKRDWGHAEDYARAMWLMLQQETSDEYVVATGEAHSVREFVEAAFDSLGLDWKEYVIRDTAYLRPTEVDYLRGDASKARRELGWSPEWNFDGLVRTMLISDARLALAEFVQRHGVSSAETRGAEERTNRLVCDLEAELKPAR